MVRLGPHEVIDGVGVIHSRSPVKIDEHGNQVHGLNRLTGRVEVVADLLECLPIARGDRIPDPVAHWVGIEAASHSQQACQTVLAVRPKPADVRPIVERSCKLHHTAPAQGAKQCGALLGGKCEEIGPVIAERLFVAGIRAGEILGAIGQELVAHAGLDLQERHDQSAVLLRLLDLTDETLDAILDLRGRAGRGGPRLRQEGRGPRLRPEGQVVVGPAGLGVASDGGLDALVHAPLDRRPPFTLFRLLCQPFLLGSPSERTPEQDQQGECEPESCLHLPPFPLLGRGNLRLCPLDLCPPRPLLGRGAECGHRRRHLAAVGRPSLLDRATGTACTV